MPDDLPGDVCATERKRDCVCYCNPRVHTRPKRQSYALFLSVKVIWAEQQVSKSRVKREVKASYIRSDGSVGFNDPMYNSQWYLVSCLFVLCDFLLLAYHYTFSFLLSFDHLLILQSVKYGKITIELNIFEITPKNKIIK